MLTNPRGISRGATNAERGWRRVRKAIREKNLYVIVDRIYLREREPAFFVLRLSAPHTLRSLTRSDSGTKAASFEGGSERKREPANTACNRVNCAAYAFISLFRDNLLIVSTKRDNPLVVECPGPVFRRLRGR